MEKRKRKKGKVITENGVVRRVAWFDEWAEGEQLRRTATVMNPSTPRIERLFQAAYDFKQGRPLHTNQDLSQLWDRWRLYIGLISGLQSPASRKKTAAIKNALAAMDEAPAEDDEDEDEDEMPNARLPKETNVLVTNEENVSSSQGPLLRTNSTYTEEQRQQRREYFREVRDTKMDRFLNDPENAVKIFFSGYYRDRGMAFSEKFCRDGPILINFFLNFLLRNRVFPESERDLRKAVAITEQARKELPHMFVVSHAIPNGFNSGCGLIFGTMTRPYVWRNTDDTAANGDTDEPDAKRQKTDGASTSRPDAPEVLQDAAGTAEIEVISPDTVEAMEKDALEDADINGEQDAPGWGAAPADLPENATGQSWGDANAAWGAPEDPEIWDTTPKSNPLWDTLGMTAFPLTHTTGVVERSTRRIKSIVPPPAATQKKGKKSAAAKGNGGVRAVELDPEAVERELEACLAQVVLIPWHEWDVYDKADVTKPAILSASRGAAITDDNEDAGDGADANATTNAQVGSAHNPFKDEITLLVDSATAEKLLIGVGIKATWIQLARADPSVPMEADETLNDPFAPNKRFGGPGEPAAPTKYWYMEEVLAVLPGFHTEMLPLPTTEDVFGTDA
ncbi:hypothetical protein GY45DRAFT_1252684 [Cubamyces sp. BRFM 1775]|nr:hypothetical protein GY45DRAFT_1252684 [Cubamyces sp. BRFM 1775]